MQTAVEWLISVLAHNDILDHKALSSNDRLYNLYKRLKAQAEAKEKQQIIDAFDEGQEYEYQYHINNAPKFYSETYYNETYGSKGSDETNGNNVEKMPNVLDDAFNQELFNYFSQEFNINLLGTEMHDIIDIVKRHTSSQTAVEWLYDKWSNCKEWKWEEIEQWFEQAKEMERKQHSKTCDKALDAFESRGHNYVRAWEDFDEHFKQFSLYEHKETITSADTPTSSQTEISDEEIEKQSYKQTSIEWLIKELKLEGYDHTIKVAKKMYDKEIDECSKKHSIQKINPSDFIDEMFKNAGRRD